MTRRRPEKDMLTLRDEGKMEKNSPVVLTTTKTAWRPAESNDTDNYNDGAGFSLSVYEEQPTRPGRVRAIKHNFNYHDDGYRDRDRDRDLELGCLGNDTTIAGGSSSRHHQYQCSSVLHNG
jgi:hypothetical protein